MTLHRTATGWRINAGRVSFDAPTVTAVMTKVLASTQDEVERPHHWDGADRATRERWATQVTTALLFLSSSVEES